MAINAKNHEMTCEKVARCLIHVNSKTRNFFINLSFFLTLYIYNVICNVYFGITNEFGQPDDEKSVGLSSGDVAESKAFISPFVSDH